MTCPSIESDDDEAEKFVCNAELSILFSIRTKGAIITVITWTLKAGL